MLWNAQSELPARWERVGSTAEPMHGGNEAISTRAAEFARSLARLPGTRESDYFPERLDLLKGKLKPVIERVRSADAEEIASGDLANDDVRWLSDNIDLVESVAAELTAASDVLIFTPHVRCSGLDVMPRVIAIAANLLPACDYRFSDSEFSAYIRGFQGVAVLDLKELWALGPALKLVLLERTAALASQWSSARKKDRATAAPNGVGTCIRSLRALEQAPWKELLEPLMVLDQVLRQDPAGAYARMDSESRALYRATVAKLAENSDSSEVEIAEAVLQLARESLRHPAGNPRLAARRSHVGYYLIAEGRELLNRRANVRVSLHERLQVLLRRSPDEFYLAGIELLTVVIIVATLWRGIDSFSLWNMLFAALVLLLPCSQSAVEVMNYLTTSLLQPRMLPKLDFREGIPDDCLTMVVVPSLLLNEKQVKRLVNDLEVRYAGNAAPNLHFALLTDLADSAEQPREDDPLVELCGELIRELNRKYAAGVAGKFFLFHRHRVYNPREGVWMGWERKRGKLLDFNKLILGDYDSFPYKIGELSILPRVRYVLTLDADTEVPRGAAHRLIGTLAHPLCQAILDPRRNIVTAGYGILQPRVGVSVQSVAGSRLASIFSGQTGFDIYTRAISDVYQDLYGEGTFVGKGLYEVRTLHQILDHRFPRNALLSHDLIEGAYARAGLVSDVEVVDHYPSHYSAHIRRKHRWLRGDWQIVEWLFPRVPDESGRRVPNPISIVSRWKILDNLRRSMVEPATLVLLLLGWTVLPGSAIYWTLVTLAILFVPPWVQFAFAFVRGVLSGSLAGIRDAFASLGTALVSVLLTLTFLVHNALVATDAIWRALYRRMVSRQRLLEWETAAEAEMGTGKRTPVDLYLIWTPAFALLAGALVYSVRRAAIAPALPILVLWASSKLVSLWLDRPARRLRKEASRKDVLLLRRTALRTWRYFAEFSDQEHNWLVPDNVREEPWKITSLVSPTNIGFLLNARQVACEFGYLTVPEFVEQTRKTLDTMRRMRHYRGHLLNWYDARTLQPVAPLFVSSVDSGNLAASLITLAGGCAALLDKPLLSPALLRGYDDHAGELADLRVLSRRSEKSLRTQEKLPWLKRLLAATVEFSIDEKRAAKGTKAAAAHWFAAQIHTRKKWAHKVALDYMPWLLPEFDSLCANPAFGLESSREQVPLKRLPEVIRQTQGTLGRAIALQAGTSEERRSGERLSELLGLAQGNAEQLIRELHLVAAESERALAEMEFGFLLDRRRKLLSIGYNVGESALHPACYDLLASEARIANFIAIAENHIPQEAWFNLGRAHVPTRGRPALISWAGTMFEYLMPSIWMRSYPGTLLQNAMEGAVGEQQAYAAEKRVPWGISESAYCETDENGVYQYRAFGAPQLALQHDQPQRLVIAPYAAVMALTVDAVGTLKNLRRMTKRGWFGAYGFYEAADYGSSPRRQRFRLAKSWMAHHQGMSLLSVANFLAGDVVQQWFHADVRVQATEMLLQERAVVRDVRPARPGQRRAAAVAAGPKAADKLTLAG